MTVTVTDLIEGPATLYYGVFGAAEPLDTEVNGTPAASAWTDLGATQGGVKVSINQTYTEMEVDQIIDIAGSRLTKRVVMITTNLAQPTLDNLARVMNTTAPVTGAGFKKLEPSGDTSATQPAYSAILLDGYAPNTKKRRVILRKTLSTEALDSEYKKDGMTLLPSGWKAHYVSSSIKPFAIIDEV